MYFGDWFTSEGFVVVSMFAGVLVRFSAAFDQAGLETIGAIGDEGRVHQR